jgi:hypothetical protein
MNKQQINDMIVDINQSLENMRRQLNDDVSYITSKYNKEINLIMNQVSDWKYEIKDLKND